MANLKPSRDIWLMIASLCIGCAITRHFGGPASIYTVFYAILVVCGVGLAACLFFRTGRHDGLIVATLAPLALLFIDLSNGWRVACFLVIAAVALAEWRSQRAAREIS